MTVVSVRPNRAVALLSLAGGGLMPGPAPGWVTTSVRVDAVQPLDGERDLLSPWLGNVVTALVRRDAVTSLLPRAGRWVTASLSGPATVRVEGSADAGSAAGRTLDPVDSVDGVDAPGAKQRTGPDPTEDDLGA